MELCARRHPLQLRSILRGIVTPGTKALLEDAIGAALEELNEDGGSLKNWKLIIGSEVTYPDGSSRVVYAEVDSDARS